MEKKVIDLSKETGEIRLILPEGYETIEVGKNTFKIQVKDPFSLVPKTLDDLYRINPELKEFFEQAIKEIEYHLNSAFLAFTKEDSEAFIAMLLLRRLWHEWVKVLGLLEFPDKVYSIHCNIYNGRIFIASDVGDKRFNSPLIFKEKSHAEKFIECFLELLDKAKILL